MTKKRDGWKNDTRGRVQRVILRPHPIAGMHEARLRLLFWQRNWPESRETLQNNEWVFATTQKGGCSVSLILPGQGRLA